MPEQKLHWRAKWIWVKDRPATEPNIYARFRKTFDLDSVPEEAIADISSDSKYMLYVNGQYVCRGIPVCDPLYQYFDRIDITPYLRPGKNVVAALVHHYGVPTCKYMLGRGGFLFECDVNGKTIATDDTWRARIEDAYTQNVPRICAIHMLHGFQEHFDARKSPIDWNETSFDDSDWQTASVVDWLTDTELPIDPWPSLVLRDIPNYFEEERPAKSIFRIGEVQDAPIGEDNDLSTKMQAEPLGNLDHGFIENAEGMVSWDEGFATVSQDKKNLSACPSVIVDFGKEVTGMLRIDVEGAEGSVVDIALAELPTSNGINHYWGNLIGMGVAHRYVLREGRQTFEIFGRFGFRYAQLTFRNLNTPLNVHRVSVNFNSYDVGARGKFECSDELLNQIWQTGAYTAQCCMYDAWEDCPGREQRQWVGDARVEALIAYAAFGDLALTRKFLLQVGQSQRPDGMTMCLYPGCTGIGNSTIQDYNLHWISAIEEYHLYSGDDDLVRELYPKVVLSMRWWEKYLNYEGLLEGVPSHLYLDATIHARPHVRGILTVLNCFYLDALDSAIKMARMNGDRDNMRHWRDISERLANAINEKLFDEEAGVYADQYYDGKLSDRHTQQANLLPLLYDIVPGERLATVWKHVTDESRLARTRQDHLSGKDITAAQPFFTYFLFEMFAKRGRTDKIVELTRKLWKPMIDAGHGTFWETWEDVREDVEKGTQSSMCHAWAGTPTYHLSSDILGVRPTAQGFDAFDIHPRTAGLSYAKGVFPSVKGDIEVNWVLDEERFKIEFSVPEQCVARVVIPVAAPRMTTLNGKETTAYTIRDGAVEFAHIGPGRHLIEATR